MRYDGRTGEIAFCIIRILEGVAQRFRMITSFDVREMAFSCQDLLNVNL